MKYEIDIDMFSLQLSFVNKRKNNFEFYICFNS